MDTHHWRLRRAPEEGISEVIGAIDAALRQPAIFRLLTPEDSGVVRYRYKACSTAKEAKEHGAWLVFNAYTNDLTEGTPLAATTFVLDYFGPQEEDPPFYHCRTRQKAYDAAVVLTLKIASDADLVYDAGRDGYIRYEDRPRALFTDALMEINKYIPTEWLRADLREHATPPSVDDMMAAYRVAAKRLELPDPLDSPIRRATRALAAHFGV